MDNEEWLYNQTAAGEEEFQEYLEDKEEHEDKMSQYIDHLIDEALGK